MECEPGQQLVLCVPAAPVSDNSVSEKEVELCASTRYFLSLQMSGCLVLITISVAVVH